MDIASLYDYCLAKPGAEETFPFGDDTLVFKVGGKMFALVGIESTPHRVNLKCEPERAMELRAEYGSVVPGYHMNKKHWNTVELQGDVPAALLREMIDHSYALVHASLPRRVREALGG